MHSICKVRISYTPDRIRQEQAKDSHIAPVTELMKLFKNQPSFEDLKYLSSETQQLIILSVGVAQIM
jgi:hypothetical protein